MKTSLASPRVLMVTDATAIGGAEKYFLSVQRALRERGWQAGLLHVAARGQCPLEGLVSDGVTMRTVRGMRETGRVLFSQCRSAASCRTIVHFNGTWNRPWLPLALLAQSTGARVVLTEHCVPPRLPPARGLRRIAPWRLSLKARSFRRRVEWGVANRVIFVGQLVREQLVGPGARLRHVVIPNGIEVDRFRRDAAARARVRGALGIEGAVALGCVGRLSREKGQDRLLEAMAQLDRSVTLVLVGDGPERAALEARAAALGVEGRVRFVGWQSNVADYLSAVDLYVLPSRYEAMPFCVLEAMANGLPVVASDVGGLREIVTAATGIVVRVNDAAELCPPIERLIADAPLRADMGARAVRVVESRFSESAMLAETLQVYEDLCPSRDE